MTNYQVQLGNDSQRIKFLSWVLGSLFIGLMWAQRGWRHSGLGNRKCKERSRIDKIHLRDISKLIWVEIWLSLGERERKGGETGWKKVREADWDQSGKGLYLTIPKCLTFGLYSTKSKQKYSERQIPKRCGGAQQGRAYRRRVRWHCHHRYTGQCRRPGVETTDISGK